MLTNPDGRLRFPGDADTTATVTVPADGSWAAFEISGEKGSDALKDAVIEAHCDTAAGLLIAKKEVTVFWFDQAKIDITPGGSYALGGGQYTVTAGNAVNYSAQARIRPAGVNCAAPQIKDLRVGIMQNDRTSGTAGEITWGNPTIAWAPGVAAGTTAAVPNTIHRVLNMPGVANDVATTVAPLYDQPGKADTLSANSLKPPIGCAGGAAATSFDTPSSPAPPTFNLPATSAAGAAVGVATYRLTSVRIIGAFMTWTVIFDTKTNEFCVLRERTWNVNVNSAAAGAQQATAAAADSAPTTTPVLAPTANTMVNDPANQNTGPAGPATTTFTK